jgi:hypothetical protein
MAPRRLDASDDQIVKSNALNPQSDALPGAHSFALRRLHPQKPPTILPRMMFRIADWRSGAT